jgi:hypothetical protein
MQTAELAMNLAMFKLLLLLKKTEVIPGQTGSKIVWKYGFL